eukprot:Gb_28853 [translate_table: standard]
MEELVDYTEDPHDGCQIWSSPIVDGSSKFSWSGGTLHKHPKVSSEDYGTSSLITIVHVIDGYGFRLEVVRNIQGQDVISYVSPPQGPFVSDGISSEVHGFSARLCSLSADACKQGLHDEGGSFGSGGYDVSFIGQSLGVTELCGRDSFLQVVGSNKLVRDLTAQLPPGEVFLNEVKSGAVRKRRRNCIKQRATPLNLVLGEEVKMHEAVDRVELTLVGRFPGCRMGDKGVKDWMQGCWVGVLGYVSTSAILSRGWLAFFLRSVVDVELLLGGSWKWDSTPLWLNHWSPFFDARKERMDLVLVWVKLPSLPLEFWSLEVFKAIGNVLGHFVEVDMFFITSGLVVITRILVRMDLREGLAESLELKKGLHSLTQPLDYSGVPFRCNRCQKYGHLVVECPLPFQRKVWVRKKSQISQVSPVAGLKDVIQVEDEQVVDKLSEGPVVDLSRKTTTGTNLNMVLSAGAEASSKEDLWKIAGAWRGQGLGLLEEKCSSSSGNNLSSNSEEKYMRYNLRPRKGSSAIVPESSLGGIKLNIGVGPKHKGSGRKSLILLAQEKAFSDIVAGLVSPSKNLALKRLVDSQKPDLLLLEETLCVVDKILGTLERLLGGWVFMCVDAQGVDQEELDKDLVVLNVYGPYNDRALIWEKLLSKDFLRWDNIILGRDLNFSLVSSEIWGSKAQVDGLSSFFFRKLIDAGLIDIEPIKLKPTWRNKRLGLYGSLKVGESDHFAVFLVLTEVGKRPRSPFKFNPRWLAEDDFVQLVKGLWLPFDYTLMESASIQFESNLKTIKLASIGWVHAKKIKDEKDLVEVEKHLEELYETQKEEAAWRLKSRALWLSEGDENTKFFHQCANHRKNINAIRKITTPDGSDACKFEDVAKARVKHFSSLFKDEERVSIAEAIRMTQFYPRFVNEEDNLSVMESVSKEELLDALHSFQKDKSPRPDGWPVEFFLGFCDSIEGDLLRVIEEPRASRRILAAFNATFIALIPKKDNPLTFEDFRPISLCNCIYKIVAKIIAKRVKSLQSKSISREQFGFLEGSWVMSCISTVSFSILINGVASDFFRISRGMRQGRDLDKFRGILDLYCSTTRMLVNTGKSTIVCAGVDAVDQGILEQMRKISFRFLWSGGKEKRGIPWVKWQRLAAVTAFTLVGSDLVWKVGDGVKVRLGEDPWVGSSLDFKLPHHMIQSLDHCLGTFVARLKASHVRISEKEDMLVWAKSPLGVYKPKVGYLALNAGGEQRDSVWWWRKVWKFRAGPGRCPLCKASEESNNHIIMECNFSKQVWKEIAFLTGLKHAWSGSTVEEGLRGWCSLSWVKEFLALPVIIAWGIWLARNASIFDEIETHPLQCASQGLGILKNFPQLVSKQISQTYCRRGSGQGRAGLGFCTNNFVELMALKLILLLANEKGVSRLQVFGDSLNVINWMRETQNCASIFIPPLVEEIRGIYLWTGRYLNREYVLKVMGAFWEALILLQWITELLVSWINVLTGYRGFVGPSDFMGFRSVKIVKDLRSFEEWISW